ncbi:MAG: alpha/beta hydrolase [Clostridia bacterium]|nr:alpha/beta hydrolase [Clostridia bacterium]
MKSYTDINYSYGRVKECLLDIYLPKEGQFDLFIYLHGGGLVEGDKGYDGKRLARDLVPEGIGVISANYRMYPNARYPDFIEDAAEAVAWAYQNLKPFPLCRKIFVGGSSAGGYLSMMLCFDEKYLGKFGIKPTDIDGYIHDAGQPTAHFNVLAERGLDGRRIIVDESAPLYHIGRADKYSPMLFIWSDADMQNRPEQLELTVSTLRHFGYDMDKVDTLLCHGKHNHYLFDNEDGSFDFGRMILPFLKSYGEVE